MNKGKKILNDKYLHNIVNESIKQILNEEYIDIYAVNELYPILEKSISILQKEVKKYPGNPTLSQQIQDGLQSLQHAYNTMKKLKQHYTPNYTERVKAPSIDDLIKFKPSQSGYNYRILKDYDNQYTKYHVMQSPYGYNFLHKQSQTLLLKDDLPNDVKLLAYDFTNPKITSPAWDLNGKMFYVDLNDKVVPYEGDVAE
jgi:hypothetical protein